MRFKIRHILPVLAVFVAWAPSASAQHTRVTNPNALSVEMFGRGLLYSIQFDRVVNDDLVAGIGLGKVSTVTLADVDTGKDTNLVPVYINYYLAKDAGSVFATVGATLVTNSSDVQNFKSNLGNVEFSSTPVLASAGLGFESRTDSGFLFRGTGYVIGSKKLSPWFGFTLGFSF